MKCTKIFLRRNTRSRNKKERAKKRKEVSLHVAEIIEREKKKPHIESLPDEKFIMNIFPNLEPASLAAASEVCTRWRDMIDWNEAFTMRWKFAYMSRNLPLDTLIELDGFPSLKQAYKSEKTRLYFAEDGEQKWVIVHDLPLNLSYKDVHVARSSNDVQ